MTIFAEKLEKDETPWTNGFVYGFSDEFTELGQFFSISLGPEQWVQPRFYRPDACPAWVRPESLLESHQKDRAQGVISVDDFIEHKPHSSLNELVSYHYDHSVGRTVRGIKIVNFTYVNSQVETKVKLPVGFGIVRKDAC